MSATKTVQCHDCQDTGMTGWKFPCDCAAASKKPETKRTINTTQYEKPILSRMLAEEAKDMSEAEITRTLTGCVLGSKLIPIALAMASEGVSLDTYRETGQVIRS